MGAVDEDTVAVAEDGAAQDSLQVPTHKKRKAKSPTPGTLRGRSATPIRSGRSSTPFSVYLTRRSATPVTFRSITPFLKREEREKTPFELGSDIKTQITCNKAVFDKALVMDITESEEVQKPVRYITSDLSVIDRACVMDVSNVEVIYVVEEYEEMDDEEPEELVEEVKSKRKGSKSRKGKSKRDKDQSPSGNASEGEEGGEGSVDREDSAEREGSEERSKKGKKKAGGKKKEKKEREHSPSPKLTLKLDLGGGPKMNKKMFEQQAQSAKPPTKKSKLAIQAEEKAKAAAAAKAAAEEEERRKKAEKEEQERKLAELRAQEEAEEQEALEAEQNEWNEDEEYNERTESREGTQTSREGTADHAEPVEEIPPEPEEPLDVWEDHVWSDPDDEDFWAEMAQREGVDFMHHIRNYAIAKRLSRETRDDDWFRRRDEAEWPRFVVFLTDRSVPVGQNLRLACAADGPDLYVNWYRDGRRLKNDDSHRIENNDNVLSLELINPNEMHSGEYRCVVTNRNDEISTTCIVTVYEVYKREPKPPVVKFVREYYHLRDDELTLECHVTGVPRPKVSWLCGRYQIVQNKTYTLIEEAHGVSKLLIFRPTSKDSGLYTCKAENDSGSAQVNHMVEIARNLHFHMEEKEKLRLKRQAENAAEMEAFYRNQRSSPEPMVSPKRKLKFATQLRDRMALIGSTVKFACTIIGPNSTTKWMKDDELVSYTGNVKNLSEEGKAILELSNVMPDSSGVYKCIARNEHCEIETSCYFKVYSAQAGGDEQEPRFALPLKDMYHFARNDLTLETKVRGNPRPTITWLRDNIPITIDDRVIQIEHLDGQCELIINEPTLDEAGIYTCLAENKLGSVKITHEVVLDDYPELQPGIPKEPKEPKPEGEGAGEGEGQQATEAPLPPPPPPPAAKEEDAVAEEKKEEEEEYVYERRYKTPEPTPLRQMLQFVANLSNRYVTEGSKVKLQAVVDGPNPAIRWKKDDENISYSSRVKNASREGLAVLEFTNCVPEDSGTYTIIATNEFSRITSTAILQVLKPAVNTDVEPVFTRSLKDTYHLIRNVMKLETGIHGQPPPQIQWFKDDVLIENGGRYEIVQHLDGACELTISCPEVDDSGKYVVKAENRAGRAEVCHLVLFEGIETHIAENIHGVFHADKSLLRQKPEEEEDEGYPQPEAYAPPPPMPPLPPSEPKKEDESKAEEPKADGDATAEEIPPEVEEEPEAAPEIPTEPEKLKKREKIIPIHFVAALKDRYAAAGSKVRFSCILEGKEPLIKWFHGESQLSNSSKIKYRHVDGLCSLEISDLTTEDDGEYTCSARDETGKVQTSANLKVYELPGGNDVAPTFTRNIRETYHYKLNELQLDTHVRGPPAPSVFWMKDGVRIKSNDKYEQVDHDDGTCELNISRPGIADSGIYICEAKNSEGSSTITHIVIIETEFKPPRSSTSPMPGEGAEDAVIAEGAQPIEAVQPLPSTFGAPTGVDSESATGAGEELPKEEEAEEAYIYTSRVPALPDLKKFVYVRNYPINQTIQEGGSVKWTVYIDGPQPAARWYRGEDPIPFSSRVKMLCQDGIATLSMTDVGQDDAGEYMLKVRGAENVEMCNFTLKVYTVAEEEKVLPPNFTVGINDTYSLTENQLVLDCRVRGKPRPTVQWRKDNAIIKMSSKHEQIDMPDGYSKLIISNPTVSDSGVYSCVARNEAAENKIQHVVNFEGSEVVATEKIHGFFHRDPNKPRFVGPLGNQTVSPGGTIMIIAEFLSSSTPIEVQWYRNHRLLTVEPDVKIFRDKGLFILALTNATNAEEGTYTCSATNEYGTVEAHATVDVASDATEDERPPLFRNRPNEKMNIVIGDPFSLSFNILEEPKPKLTFFRGTVDITNAERVTKEKDISDDSIRFTVQQSQVSDCGVYFVVARNKFGTDRIFSSITVKNPKKKEDE